MKDFFIYCSLKSPVIFHLQISFRVVPILVLTPVDPRKGIIPNFIKKKKKELEMKRKFFSVVMILAAFISMGCRKNPDPLDPRFDVSFESHSGPGIASYFVVRCNPSWGGCSQPEAGNIYMVLPLGNTIGAELLQKTGSYIILRSDSDHEWVYYDSGLFSDARFVLRKK